MGCPEIDCFDRRCGEEENEVDVEECAAFLDGERLFSV